MNLSKLKKINRKEFDDYVGFLYKIKPCLLEMWLIDLDPETIRFENQYYKIILARDYSFARITKK